MLQIDCCSEQAKISVNCQAYKGKHVFKDTHFSCKSMDGSKS